MHTLDLRGKKNQTMTVLKNENHCNHRLDFSTEDFCADQLKMRANPCYQAGNPIFDVTGLSCG